MKIQTGITELDKLFNGGVHPGTLAVITLPLGSDHLQVIGPRRGNRSSILLTTFKSQSLIERTISRGDNNNIRSIRELDPGSTPTALFEHVSDLEKNEDLYISTIGAIEKTLTTEIYLDLLNSFSQELKIKGVVGYVFCYKQDNPTYNRTITLDIADLVMELNRESFNEGIGHQLNVFKYNGKQLPSTNRTVRIQSENGIDNEKTNQT